MKNFGRALRDALHHWPALTLATLCSLAVAALWGGNIGALYPIIEVTFGGSSLQEWIADEITHSQERIAAADRQLLALQAQAPPATATERQQVQQSVDRLQQQREVEVRSLARSERLQPWLEDYFPHDPLQTVVLIVFLLMIATVIKHAFLLLNTWLVARVSNAIAQDIRQRVFAQAIDMDRAGFSGYGTSSFVAYLTNTTDMLTMGITNVFGGAIREPLKLISCLLGAAFVCWRLLLVSLIVVPLVAVLVIWVSRSIKLACRKMIERSIGFHHVMHEAFGNLQTVQAYNMQSEERRRFAVATEQMRDFGVQMEVLNGLTRPITELLGLGMVGITIVVGAYLVINQVTEIGGIRLADRPLSISQILVFFGLLVGASDPVRKMSTVLAGINTGVVAADMLFPLLDRRTQIVDPAEPQVPARPHRQIEFQRVNFSYREGHPVLRDVNLAIPHGQHLAIVGPNGSGKSSLINLLCRFYDPNQGAVRIDGMDLRQMSLFDLRSRIGLVTQQTELMNETIDYNIRYGTLQATEAEVRRAAELAHAAEFIDRRLPEGYQTRVGQHGHRLSGGQRQRIALARAILRNPDILILDEATSQIDVESEELILQTLRQFGQGRTLILITHRPKLLELADVVWRFEEGRVTVEPRVVSSAA